MQFDRKITISAGSSRRAMVWQAQTLLISELWAKLQTPARGTEPLAEYLNMKKAQQDDLKDVGGFMAGTLSGPRRKANNVTGRDVITLDLDNIPSGGTEDVLRRVEGLGCGYCIYSTRKHSPAAPRLRVLLPLDRTASADEYGPIARKMAEYIGLELCDPTTFEVSRLMYWPSCCSDSQYIYVWKDKPLLSVKGLLGQYEDWRDCTLWPQVPGSQNLPTKLAVKQGDPEAKNGVVGAFCRTYDIYRAMDELIPGMYEPVESMPGRYTYLGGSTTGGAVIYDSGKFLYSHHATDPCSGKLVNAFDLVRLHRFGDKDDEAQPGTPTNRLPSYRAMCELATQDPDVSALMSQERYQEAVKDFEGVEATNDAEPANWMDRLEINSQTGLPKATIDNVWIILENDPLLKGKFALNQFAGRGEVLDALPWNASTKRRLWDDNDNNGLYWYMEKVHHITGNGKIDGALSLHTTQHAFNEVQDYLQSLKWDGVPRLDTLFIDYLGAEDSPYTRAVTRKAFTAAVTRAMVPGSKYDNMLILAGPQGIGKSTLLDKMSRGWFNDSIRTFEGKEASELLQGVWLVEIGELDAFRKTDVACIKQFLSLRSDRFRAAYGRHVKELPRCCVFFGTTNTSDYSGISAKADEYAAKSAEAYGSVEEYQNIGDAFTKGYNTFDTFTDGWASDAFKAGASWGDGVADKVSSFFDFGGGGTSGTDLGSGFDLSSIADNTGLTADNTGKTADALAVTEEQLEYLRDIAERDAINRFTTAEVKIDMTGMTNRIDGSADLDGVISQLTEGFTEALVTAAEGVHA